jgi:hypothetical protein
MRPWIAADFVQNNRYQNMYQAVAEASVLSGRNSDELLRERLGPYYAARLAFDHGDRFRYGALNIGNAGTRQYGLFCIVFRGDFPPPGEQVAYLKTDSLKGYVSAAGTLDEVALRRDAAGPAQRHILAAIKHAGDVTRRASRWPDMICGGDTYIEAIFVIGVTTATVAEVRVLERDYWDLWNLCFAAHGRTLSEEEKATAFDFLSLLRADRAGVIQIRVVSDA